MADALGAAAKARRQNTPRKETGNAPAPDQVETRSGHLVVRAAAIADPRGVDVSVKPRTLIEQALGCDFVRERFVVGAGAGTGAFSVFFRGGSVGGATPPPHDGRSASMPRCARGRRQY